MFEVAASVEATTMTSVRTTKHCLSFQVSEQLSDARSEPTSFFTQLFSAIISYQQSAYVKQLSSIVLAFKKEHQLFFATVVMVEMHRLYVVNMKIISTKEAHQQL